MPTIDARVVNFLSHIGLLVSRLVKFIGVTGSGVEYIALNMNLFSKVTQLKVVIMN